MYKTLKNVNIFFRKVDTTSIDKLFGAPDKIEIPERYVPEKETSVDSSGGSGISQEERRKKMEKVESIRRMLGAQTPATVGGPSQSAINMNEENLYLSILKFNPVLISRKDYLFKDTYLYMFHSIPFYTF